MSIFALVCLYKIIRLLGSKRARYYLEKTVNPEFQQQFIKVEISCYVIWIVLFIIGDGYNFFFIEGHKVDLIDGFFLAGLAASIIAVLIIRLKTERKMYK